MSLSFAVDIVARLGPSTIALDAAALPDLARELGLLGCAIRAPGEAAPVALRIWSGSAAAMLAETDACDRLIVAGAAGQRRAVEQAVFAAGWRRHPGGLILAEAHRWTATEMPALTYYRRGYDDDLFAQGVVADAALARFAWAAGQVRTGDRVLVAGADAAAGSAAIAALARIAAIAARSLDTDWRDVGPVEAVVLILTAGRDVAALLAAARDVLVGDGRLLLLWDETALPDRATIRDAVDGLFISDSVWRQPPGGIGIVTDAADGAVGWTMLTASVDPFEPAAHAYRHPAFHACKAGGAVVDFGGGYDNPFLYRTMVQMGERVQDAVKLARLAEIAVAESRADSADRGAAIAVLGYRVLEMRLTGSVPAIMALIEAYLAATEAQAAPHVLRWRLSLTFLAGRLMELTGEREAALDWYRAAVAGDWAAFSPLLATKAVAAAFFAGRIAVADGAHAAAMAFFRQGVAVALAAAAAPHAALIGEAAQPVPFYLPELAEVIDMGSQCALALSHAPLLARDPGLFWRTIDVRRFGLSTWAGDLARENARLRGG